MAILEAKLKPVIDEAGALDARMKALAAELKSIDDQDQSGAAQLPIDARYYNAKVKEHNALLEKRRALVAANKADLQTYNELEKQDSALVEKYNASLGPSR